MRSEKDDHDLAIAQKKAELAGIDAQSVLAMRKLDDATANKQWPVDLMAVDLEVLPSTFHAREAIVMQELMAALVTKGITIDDKQKAALNNYISRKSWNMPAGAGSLLVPRIPAEIKALDEQIEAKKNQLLRTQLGDLAKTVDQLAANITLHWLDSQTKLMDGLIEKAKSDARTEMNEKGLGGLAYLRSYATVNGITLAEDGDSGEVVSLADQRRIREDGPALKAAVQEMHRMLTSDDLFVMSHVANNHENKLVRDAARAEDWARKYIHQRGAQAAIRFWKEFVEKEINDLISN